MLLGGIHKDFPAVKKRCLVLQTQYQNGLVISYPRRVYVESIFCDYLQKSTINFDMIVVNKWSCHYMKFGRN